MPISDDQTPPDSQPLPMANAIANARVQELVHMPFSNLRPGADPTDAKRRGHNGEDYGHEWSAHMRDKLDLAVDACLKEFSPDTHRLADIGCASGARASQFAMRGFHVTGVDIALVKQEIFKRNADLLFHGNPMIDFMEGDVSDAALDFGGPFAMINMRRVLHFLPYESVCGVTARLADKLIPGGYIAASSLGYVPPLGPHDPGAPPQKMGSRPRNAKGWWDHDIRDVARLFAGAGLEIKDVFYTSSSFGLLARKPARRRIARITP